MKKTHGIITGVATSLITALIIAVIDPLREIALSVLKWIWGVILAFWIHLTSVKDIPCWLIYIAIIVFAALIWHTVKNHIKNFIADAVGMSPLDYTEDSFHGLVWRWSMGSNAYPYGLATFCPNCDMQMLPSQTMDVGVFHGTEGTEYICDKCDFKSNTIKMHSTALVGWVEREIQRKIRTNKYKEVVAKQGR